MRKKQQKLKKEVDASEEMQPQNGCLSDDEEVMADPQDEYQVHIDESSDESDEEEDVY